MARAVQDRSVQRARAVWVVAVLVVAVAGFAVCARQNVEIFGVSLVPDSGGKVLSVDLDSCNQDSRVAVHEASDAVTLRATAKRAWGLSGGRGACADSVRVHLRDPLGERSVVNGDTGEVIDVGVYP